MVNSFSDLQDMNANCITIMAEISQSQCKVLPVVNTCLDNITAASEAMDPVKGEEGMRGWRGLAQVLGQG